MATVSAFLACAIGAALGLRFKFAVLFPASIVVALVALIADSNSPVGHTLLLIVVNVLTLQLGFLAGAATNYWLLHRHYHHRSNPVRTDKNSGESPHPAQGPIP